MTRAGGCQQAPMSPARRAARGFSGIPAAVRRGRRKRDDCIRFYFIDIGMLGENHAGKQCAVFDQTTGRVHVYMVRLHPGLYIGQHTMAYCNGKVRKELGRE